MENFRSKPFQKTNRIPRTYYQISVFRIVASSIFILMLHGKYCKAAEKDRLAMNPQQLHQYNCNPGFSAFNSKGCIILLQDLKYSTASLIDPFSK